MLTPFCPVSLVHCQCFFFFNTDHCIGFTGDVSDTKSVSTSVRMLATVPPPLLVKIKIRKILPFVNAITFT
ncbi:unnamed protein product [Staurois parvus]|uniref:Secreted protein n=1 Tax=Staurois parvus TaxID=386267 RepID=A0ABN9DHZ4_9NEOB|nr:unnamed protein product [Staurois parvus]